MGLTVVIGGGIVGLAVARALRGVKKASDVIVLEAESALASHASSRNSEVVHSGIYYKTGSMKHKMCMRGKGLLQTHCEREGVPFRTLGKLIVATSPAQESELARLLKVPAIGQHFSRDQFLAWIWIASDFHIFFFRKGKMEGICSLPKV